MRRFGRFTGEGAFGVVGKEAIRRAQPVMASEQELTDVSAFGDQSGRLAHGPVEVLSDLAQLAQGAVGVGGGPQANDPSPRRSRGARVPTYSGGDMQELPATTQPRALKRSLHPRRWLGIADPGRLDQAAPSAVSKAAGDVATP